MATPWGGGQDSELITHLITDVTVDRVFPW